MASMKAIGMTTDYLVWCAGNSVGWDCTVQDIADEIGYDYARVRESLKRRGWLNRVNDASHGRNFSRPAVDHLMRNNDLTFLARA